MAIFNSKLLVYQRVIFQNLRSSVSAAEAFDASLDCVVEEDGIRIVFLTGTVCEERGSWDVEGPAMCSPSVE